MTSVVIIGAGGQARETAWIIGAAQPTWDVRGFVVTDLSRLGPLDSHERVLGDYGWIRANRHELAGVVIGIGTPRARLKVAADLVAELGDAEASWPAILHPSAIFDRSSCVVGPGVLVHPGVVATVNVHLGAYCMVNNSCTIGHETRVGRGSVINPGANLSGAVTIGDGVLIGTGAQVLQGLTIGDGATVGAGAVVTRDVPAGITVVGVPARPLHRESESPRPGPDALSKRVRL